MYAAAERLYSIYYKLRRERDEAELVRNLIQFMAVFYRGNELADMASTWLVEAAQSPPIREGLERALDASDTLDLQMEVAKALLFNGITHGQRDESEAALREGALRLKALVAAVGILTALGFAGTLTGYIDPGVALTSAEFRIIPLPEISAEELGYTPEEGVMLIGLGILWKSLAAFLYLVIVVGGHLAMAIRRANSAGGTSPAK